MKKNMKIIIPIIFVLIFGVAIISGCLHPNNFPVMTEKPIIDYKYSSIKLGGDTGVPFCKTKNHSFVYDTISHNNWSDYAFKRKAPLVMPDGSVFFDALNFSIVTHNVTYYVRAVAYCYDFKKPYEDYVEGYYQGNEQTFIVN